MLLVLFKSHNSEQGRGQGSMVTLLATQMSEPEFISPELM